VFGLKTVLNGWSHASSVSDKDRPVFIFAICWRTGSTLLQRVINASGQIFIWGEPAFLPEAAALFNRLQDYLGRVEHNREKAFQGKVGAWIPVVSPPPERAVNAFRVFFDELYARETSDRGMNRWGFKEVRSQAVSHIKLLREIFPHARFIFLVRDPYDTYKSVKGKKFFSRFKDPFQPVKIWNKNAIEFLRDKEIEEICLLVRYEELIQQSQDNHQLLEKIALHIQIEISGKMFQEIGSQTDPSGAGTHLDEDEIRVISGIVENSAQQLGYEIR
jgi:hypothetical protein